jgi:hypothetical protein
LAGVLMVLLGAFALLPSARPAEAVPEGFIILCVEEPQNGGFVHGFIVLTPHGLVGTPEIPGRCPPGVPFVAG